VYGNVFYQCLLGRTVSLLAYTCDVYLYDDATAVDPLLKRLINSSHVSY